MYIVGQRLNLGVFVKVFLDGRMEYLLGESVGRCALGVGGDYPVGLEPRTTEKQRK
jgi:hypothetical protein